MISWGLTPELRGAAKRHPLERIVMRRVEAQTYRSRYHSRAGTAGTYERYPNGRLSERSCKSGVSDAAKRGFATPRRTAFVAEMRVDG
jgi:hypothetical protein